MEDVQENSNHSSDNETKLTVSGEPTQQSLKLGEESKDQKHSDVQTPAISNSSLVEVA